MTLTQRAATGRFYDLGGAAEAPIFSACYLNLPQGPILGSSFSPAGWFLDNASPPPTGLFSPIGPGPAGSGRPIAGIIANGDGTDVTITLKLDVAWVDGPVPVGATETCQFTIARNGVPFYQQSQSVVVTGIFYSHIFSLAYTVTGIAVSAGDVYTAGVQFTLNPNGITKMPSGSGQQDLFQMSGLLTPPAPVPGQPPMRLHGAVGAEY